MDQRDLQPRGSIRSCDDTHFGALDAGTQQGAIVERTVEVQQRRHFGGGGRRQDRTRGRRRPATLS
jgi:hypothetical protein